MNEKSHKPKMNGFKLRILIEEKLSWKKGNQIISIKKTSTKNTQKKYTT